MIVRSAPRIEINASVEISSERWRDPNASRSLARVHLNFEADAQIQINRPT